MDRRSKTKATKKRMDSGVAGRNMMANGASREKRTGSPETDFHDSLRGVEDSQTKAQLSERETAGFYGETSRQRASTCGEGYPAKGATN